MYVVYINLLYFFCIFLFTYNKNLLSQKEREYIWTYKNMQKVTWYQIMVQTHFLEGVT